MYVRCYLLILLQSFQCRGGIISDLCSLCRSQSLGTSHSIVYCTIISVERWSLGNTSLHRDNTTSPPLKEYSSVLYYTILYYTKRRDCDRSYMEIDGIMWYTTFWSSIYANSKMVNNISVALSVFKWAAQIFIVCLVNLGHLEAFDFKKTFITYTEDNQHSKEPLQIKIQFLKN